MGTVKYAHTNIISKDWKKLAAFYVDTFQCKLVPPVRQQSGKWLEKGTGLQNAQLEGAHLLLPGHGRSGPTLEIYQYATVADQPPTAPNLRGFGHIAFEVEDVDDTLIKVKENGGQSLGQTTTRQIEGVGTITFVYARDPDGNVIELQHWQELK